MHAHDRSGPVATGGGVTMHAVADPIAQFRAAIERAGLPVPPEVRADGALHRFGTNGKASDDSGWYVLHADGAVPAGAFGDWRSGVSQTWQADLGRNLTAEERRAHRERVEVLSRMRELEGQRRHVAAAERARTIWGASIARTGGSSVPRGSRRRSARTARLSRRSRDRGHAATARSSCRCAMPTASFAASSSSTRAARNATCPAAALRAATSRSAPRAPRLSSQRALRREPRYTRRRAARCVAP